MAMILNFAFAASFVSRSWFEAFFGAPVPLIFIRIPYFTFKSLSNQIYPSKSLLKRYQEQINLNSLPGRTCLLASKKRETLQLIQT